MVSKWTPLRQKVLSTITPQGPTRGWLARVPPKPKIATQNPLQLHLESGQCAAIFLEVQALKCAEMQS